MKNVYERQCAALTHQGSKRKGGDASFRNLNEDIQYILHWSKRFTNHAGVSNGINHEPTQSGYKRTGKALSEGHQSRSGPSSQRVYTTHRVRSRLRFPSPAQLGNPSHPHRRWKAGRGHYWHEANKAQVWVLQALHRIRQEIPFPILGIDSDNGGEFINNHLLRFCEACKITFTRSRPFHKNDSCYVEQKNYSIVRKAAGYYRYDNDQQLALLDQLYSRLRLYTNFFQPVMKLVSKTRTGSSVRKHYDTPKTPFDRLLLQPNIPTTIKDNLSNQFMNLNPADLKRSLAHIQNSLFLSHTPTPKILPGYNPPPLNHPWRRSGTLRSATTTPLRVDSQQDILHPPSPP